MGLHGRLKSHYQGRRSGDQFCVYVADRYVLCELTADRRREIGAGTLSLDNLVRDFIHNEFSFRCATVEDYSTAIRVENAVKGGALGGPPRLNPRPSPTTSAK